MSKTLTFHEGTRHPDDRVPIVTALLLFCIPSCRVLDLCASSTKKSILIVMDAEELTTSCDRCDCDRRPRRPCPPGPRPSPVRWSLPGQSTADAAASRRAAAGSAPSAVSWDSAARGRVRWDPPRRRGRRRTPSRPCDLPPEGRALVPRRWGRRSAPPPPRRGRSCPVLLLPCPHLLLRSFPRRFGHRRPVPPPARPVPRPDGARDPDPPPASRPSGSSCVLRPIMTTNKKGMPTSARKASRTPAPRGAFRSSRT